ncbi:helix-turn-helix domain-containing protein [Actinomadura sp. 3N508]|uniref:helix-turn-helix domain-containing protein n=1 Tax=Actinomadura sp. 3N508 TaxID=3375153 RepID=UPI0037B04371
MTAARRQDEAPSVRHQLAEKLRALRELSGQSGRELAGRIGISQSQISRIESGKTPPTMPQVKQWATAVKATAETKAWLIAMTEAAYTEVDAWLTVLGDRPHLQDEIGELEARTRRTRCFQHSVVPGLLQTAQYARLVFGLYREVPYAKEDLAAAVAGRLDRQLALFDTERRFEFLITEAALRWRPGSVADQLAQLDRLTSLATLENVSIGLIPQSTRALTYLSHSFVIYAADDALEQESIVITEAIHARVTAHKPEDIALYEDRWSLLRQMAVFDDAKQDLLSEIAASLRRLPECT